MVSVEIVAMASEGTPAEPAAPTSGGGWRTIGHHKARAKETAYLIVLFAAVCMGSVLAFLAYAASEQDSREQETGYRTLETILNAEREELENGALLLAKAIAALPETTTQSRIVALDPNGEIARQLDLAAAIVIDPERSAGSDDEQWVLFSGRPAPAIDIRPVVERMPEGSLTTLGFLPADKDGGVRLVAAARSVQSSVSPEKRLPIPILVVVRDLDERKWTGYSADYGLTGLTFASNPTAAGLGLRGIQGQTVGRLTWKPDRPGWQMMRRAMAPIAFVFVVLTAFSVFLVRRSAREALALEEGAIRFREANRDLAESRQRFRDFAEASSDWFWETGPDHRYTFVSERVALILGDEPGKVFGDSLLALGGLAENRDAWAECLNDIQAARAFRDLEVTWVDASEKTFIFRISGQPVFDAYGKFRGYRGSGIDVTVETLALMEARFMQEVVQDSLDSISEGFVLFSADGRLLFCNDQYRKAYPNLADVLLPGITFKEILRVAAERSNAVDAQDNIGTWIQERIERHLGRSSPADRFLSNGRWYRISEHATPSGGVVKLLTDITELKEREQQLAGQISTAVESERRYRQLFELAPYGIVMWDGDEIRFSNTSAVSILGVGGKREGLDGQRLARFFENGDAIEAQLIEAAEGKIQRITCHAVRPDGERRAIELSAFPAVFKKEPTVLLFIDDVTDRKRVEQELQRSQKMEAVGRMAGGIAHEFNNMLTAIGGFARLAERGPEDAERVLSCVREIAKASDRAAALTGQLLDFSRRRVTEETEIVALADVVTDLKVFLKPLMSTGVDLTIDIVNPDVHVVANPVTLNQAILNLAINARDAMPEGGRLTIVLDSVQPRPAFFKRHDVLKPGRYAVISVTDTGTGIPEEIRDRIWEPFFTTKEQGKGTGLGLAMVYGTAQQAGGVVELASEMGVGTSFTIYLPQVEAPVLDEGIAESLILDDGVQLNILLVDDEGTVRSFMKMALEEAGCTVTEANDGLDAVEKFDAAGGLFDAVVSDVSMPRMNGAELAKALEERNPYLRMLFLTGYASREQAAVLMGKEGWHLLMKPVSPEKLIQAVRELVAE